MPYSLGNSKSYRARCGSAVQRTSRLWPCTVYLTAPHDTTPFRLGRDATCGSFGARAVEQLIAPIAKRKTNRPMNSLLPWHADHPGDIGFLALVSAHLAKRARQSPGLPVLRACDTLHLFSDYGGEHPDSEYEVLSYLLVDLSRSHDWRAQWHDKRAQFLPDGRRMAYKKLNDLQRQLAMWPYLAAANHLWGLSFSVAVNRAAGPFFGASHGGQERDDQNLPPYFISCKPAIRERAMRIVSLAALLIGGFSGDDQNVTWFTDQDKIVPTQAALSDLLDLFERVNGHFIGHRLGRMKIGTSASDKNSKILQDLLAIPDIVAGALSDQFTETKRTYGTVASRLTLPPVMSSAGKTHQVLNWFADNRWPLKRVVCLLEPAGEGRITVALLDLHGIAEQFELFREHFS